MALTTLCDTSQTSVTKRDGDPEVAAQQPDGSDDESNDAEHQAGPEPIDQRHDHQMARGPPGVRRGEARVNSKRTSVTVSQTDQRSVDEHDEHDIYT